MTTPNDLFRLLKLIESSDRDTSTPEGYVRLKDGSLVML
jgi:hypothetical protein